MTEHIVILGGGFAGWYAARALAPRLRAGHSITVVDRVDHMLYTPMLTEVAGGNLRPESIAVPLQDLPRRVRKLVGDIKGVDVASKTVTMASGERLEATQLVFALGSTTAHHGVEGAAANSIPLKTLADAELVLSRTDELIRQAERNHDASRRRELLTLVVAGGGYTGVETIAAVAEHMRRRVRAAGGDERDVNAILIEPSDRLMHETPESLALYSQRLLERQGVRVILKTAVKQVTGDIVLLENGEQLRAGLLVWDAGIEPSPLLAQTALPLGKHHGVEVDECFRVKWVCWGVGAGRLCGDSAEGWKDLCANCPECDAGRDASGAEHQRGPTWRAAAAVPLQHAGTAGVAVRSEGGRRDSRREALGHAGLGHVVGDLHGQAAVDPG